MSLSSITTTFPVDKKEKWVNPKGVIRSRKFKKERRHNDLQNTTQKSNLKIEKHLPH